MNFPPLEIHQTKYPKHRILKRFLKLRLFRKWFLKLRQKRFPKLRLCLKLIRSLFPPLRLLKEAPADVALLVGEGTPKRPASEEIVRDS